ncbi:LysR family transcriptional regulator [Kitasatospora sp. CB02891]|uniref:LysR family transcriptional regulator n=1 Tax=Kitasatospora sp. CB02891 TaxID=2020329 RepID=UPI000C27F3D3|nr:LysR family transcriptional regulator [Kitasatospora sp. CB02891]PJN29407.1 LysR family transcriptional regulator [Kitasatospora sp. CB02891]
METRELHYFVAVAEELNFGRAARRLGMAQPPLSRAIAQLERRLGTVLLERDSRGVTLTGAGHVLLREGRTVLAAVAAAEARTRRAGQPPGLVLAAKAGASTELLAALLDAYAAGPDPVPVDLRLCRFGEQERLLREGAVDAALLHLPFDSTAGLDTEELHTEGQVALLPAGHPLAARTALRLAELAALPDLPAPRFPRRDGSYPDGPGPEIRDHAQLSQLVALGRMYAVLPDSSRTQLRPGVTAVPVPDARPVTSVLAWDPTARSRPLAGLVRAAIEVFGVGTNSASAQVS